MVTLIKYGAAGGGAKYNTNVMTIDGLSTDTKPTEIDGFVVPNGSVYTEIDTGATYMYDGEGDTWYEVSLGGGGAKGGIILKGETTTPLADNATTNPIVIDGQSYTAQPNDAVIYGSKEFLFDGTKWHEFGDLSGLSSKDIGAMTNYAKAATADAISTSDTLNQAVGKLEKGLDGKQASLTQTQLDAVNSGIDSTKVGQIEANKESIDGQQNATASGGNGYALINGTRVYVASSAPTGNIPDGSIGVGW